MKTSNWSLIGYAAGFIFALVSFIQYDILHSDLDRVIAYPIIGILICAVSWLYNQNLKHGNTLTAIEDYLAENKYTFDDKDYLVEIPKAKAIKNIWTTW